MPARRLPVQPNLDQLHNQAKDLLRDMHARGEPAKLADAQLALAREYGVSSWTRLVHAVPQRAPAVAGFACRAASMTASMKAGRSSGLRLVIRLPSRTTSASE